MVSVGTETDGSLIGPAAVNGVVGIKPTLGLTSTLGVIPISHNQDTVGVVARTVIDAAILLSVLAEPIAKGGNCYEKYCRLELVGARIGYFENAPPDQLVGALIESLGGQLIEVSRTGFPTGTNQAAVLDWDFKNDLEKYLGTRATTSRSGALLKQIRNLRDVLVYTLGDPREMSQVYDVRQFTSALNAGNADLQALENRRIARNWIDGVMFTNQLDAMLDYMQPAAMAGYPKITIPFGTDKTGLPKAVILSGGPIVSRG